MHTCMEYGGVLCVCVCMHVHKCTGIWWCSRKPDECLRSLETGVSYRWVVSRHAGAGNWTVSSARTTSTLKHWAIFLSPLSFCFWNRLTLNLWSSCLILLRVWITGVCPQGPPLPIFINILWSWPFLNDICTFSSLNSMKAESIQLWVRP